MRKQKKQPVIKSSILCGIAILLALLVNQGEASAPRVLPQGKLPKDVRLGDLKDLNGYHPFKPPQSLEEWSTRAKALRRRVKVANGIWPEPTRTPLNAKIYGKVERPGFTVEKVQFESLPGNIVTGSLFRPTHIKGKIPAVLCPHGHWSNGRKYDAGVNRVRSLIVQGQERFESSGRNPQVARCAQLARMGCSTFLIDMIGYADNNQISYQVAHRYGTIRPEFETKENWGFFSPQAELRLQSIMGLQTWNCIRALDFLCALPEVDAKRIGITGCSGGGTQTILLGAVDPRPVVSFPQGMVSTSMQGGCTCENCSLLRIGHGNVELAGLFAPKPQGMTAANDWTKEMATKGFPELKQLYTLYGAADKVQSKDLLQFPHNYNYVTRALMYNLFNKYLKLGFAEPVVEGDFKRLTDEELTVWDAEHPAPKPTGDYERNTVKWMTEDAERQLAALTPTNKNSLATYREVVGWAVDVLIGRSLPEAKDLEREKIWKKDRETYLEFGDLLRNKKHGEEFPIVSLFPKKKWNKRVVIWVNDLGKSGIYNRHDNPRTDIIRLLEAGTSVITLDQLYTGEFLVDESKPLDKARVVKNPRQFAGYTYGYNHSLFAQRVHDVLTLIAFVKHDGHGPEQISLVGMGKGSSAIVAAARAQAGEVINRAVVDTQGFRFVNLTSFRDPNFLPGIVKYGDLPTLLAISAPSRLYIMGEKGKLPSIVSATYHAAGSDSHVISDDNAGGAAQFRAISWLLK